MIKVELADGKVVETKRKMVANIIKELGLTENSVLVAKGDELLTHDTALEDGDSIRIISVVSGG